MKGTWDLESVYDEKIAPLMAQIITVCKEHNIPVVASFAYGQDEDEALLCTTYINGVEGREVDALGRALREIRGNRILALAITTTEAESP